MNMENKNKAFNWIVKDNFLVWDIFIIFIIIICIRMQI